MRPGSNRGVGCRPARPPSETRAPGRRQKTETAGRQVRREPRHRRDGEIVRAPTAVWIDDRVAGQMATEKDPELAERGVEQVQYLREDIVKRMLADARGAEEVVVQISQRRNERDQDRLALLTNYGRIFVEVTGGWKELPGPGMAD